MIKQYKLVNREVVECSLDEWAEWFSKAWREDEDSRRVALDETGGHQISTVFLGLSHSIFEGRLDIFETAVFDISGDVSVMQRYDTWQTALDGHNECVEAMRKLESESAEITREALDAVRYLMKHRND